MSSSTPTSWPAATVRALRDPAVDPLHTLLQVLDACPGVEIVREIAARITQRAEPAVQLRTQLVFNREPLMGWGPAVGAARAAGSRRHRAASSARAVIEQPRQNAPTGG